MIQYSTYRIWREELRTVRYGTIKQNKTKYYGYPNSPRSVRYNSGTCFFFLHLLLLQLLLLLLLLYSSANTPYFPYNDYFHHRWWGAQKKGKEGKGREKEKKRKEKKKLWDNRSWDRTFNAPLAGGGGTKGMCSYEYLQSVIMASPPVSRVNKTKLLYCTYSITGAGRQSHHKISHQIDDFSLCFFFCFFFLRTFFPPIYILTFSVRTSFYGMGLG